MILFTSDTHFGHKNIIEFCKRPFQSVEEMNETLIANWNEKVHSDDIVYILGDLFFRMESAEAIETVLDNLKGRKHLIIGNHDTNWMPQINLNKYFVSVQPYLETSISNCGVTLCHYPLLVWHHMKRTFMIHGHIHNDRSMDYWPLLQARDRVLNAGTDINHFVPVSFDELVENNRIWKNDTSHSDDDGTYHNH